MRCEGVRCVKSDTKDLRRLHKVQRRLFITILGVNLCSFVFGVQRVTEHFGVDIWRFLSPRKRQRVSRYRF